MTRRAPELHAPRIVFWDQESQDQGTPVRGGTTPSVVISGGKHGHDLTKANTGDIREESGPTVASAVLERGRKDRAIWAAVIPTDVAKEVTGGFGSLSAALGTIYTKYEETAAVRNKTENLLSHIAALEALFATRPGNVAEQGRRNVLIRELRGIEGQLRSSYETPVLQQLDDPVQCNGGVFRLLEDLQGAIFHYQIARQSVIREQEYGLIDPAEAAILNNFRCAQAAEYRHGDRNGCMKGTRGAVLDEIELWTKDFDTPPVYWLNGLAGTGKSTIAQTIAERTFATGRLGASFFCSRDFLDRSNLQFIFPTLAVQLARKFTAFRSILVPLVRSDPGIVDESLYHQMEKFIVRPLKESGVSTVIIIDALDECRDDKPTSAILSVLAQLVSEIPKVKFFLTGRPERRVREGFRLPRMAEATDVFVLHEVEACQVDSDIRLFFEHSFAELASRWHGLEDWPTKGQLDILCERAAGLFVYAVATVKFIDHKNNGPGEQLARLLKTSESSTREGKTELKEGMTLDSLYMSILREAFGRDDPEDDHKTRSVLGAVALAANPLPPSAIATLLGFHADGVFFRLSSVHSLLILREDISHPVRPFHKSFPDFIIDPTRCTDRRFLVSPPDHHSDLLVGCLELMNQKLEKNMCKLPDGVVNSDVDDLGERIDQYVGHGLRYACESWHKHLVDLRTVPSRAPKITFALHRFLEEKFLFWLEVLSVLGTVRCAVGALEAVAKWLEALPTLDLVNDYFRFITGFFEVISTSASHIYHSALPLSPRTSIVRTLHERYAHPFLRIVQGAPMSWDPSIASIKCSDSIRCIAWSPCSRFIAISLGTVLGIQILDAVTLKRLKTFTPRHHSTQFLGFSPDSRSLLWSGDRSDVLTSWDLQTGVRVDVTPTKPGTFPYVLSTTYSGCGTFLGFLFQGDNDTIAISSYNIRSRAPICYHQIEGTNTSTIWTHGDCIRFATFRPGSIAVWEIGFTSRYPPVQVESLPTPDNFGFSGQFLFLPTPARLAFTSIFDNVVLVWDAQQSKLLLRHVGASRMQDDMSFSSDGHFFACGADRPEIYLWKESPTGYILHRKLISSDASMSFCKPLLSPSGQSIVASGYPPRLQLWRTTDSFTPPSSIPTQDFRHTERFVLGFSPDGSLAVTARLRGDTVTVLDLKSGVTRSIIDTGTTIHGLGVARSPAVIDNGKLVTWNLPAGVNVLHARVTHRGGVLATRLGPPIPFASPGPYSVGALHSDDTSPVPDLTTVDSTFLRIYDTPTGAHITNTGITDVWGDWVWFTPDGREVWFIRSAGHGRGWAIVRDSESNDINLRSLGSTGGPSGGFPWQSSRGCQVTDDGWVLNSAGKRLLWLPPHWRSAEMHRAWCGRFLALLHSGLPEVVVLEVLVE